MNKINNNEYWFNYYCNYPDYMIQLVSGDVGLKIWEKLYFRLLMSPVMKCIYRRRKQ